MEFYTVKAFECMNCNAEMAPYAEPDEDGNIPEFMAPSSVIIWERVFPATELIPFSPQQNKRNLRKL